MSAQAQIVGLLRDLQPGIILLIFIAMIQVVRALANDVIVMRNGIAVERGRRRF
jgi:microcin C transport system ATP-binding protein